MHGKLVAFVILVTIATYTRSAEIYVSSSQNSTQGCGSSAAPCPTIQDGINLASNGDTVTVMNGTYEGPGNSLIDYLGKQITVMCVTNIDR
jgi:hypothetical protein